MDGTTCLLFFPATRPDLLAKALATGADAVCVDLEDSVAPEARSSARDTVGELLDAHDGPARMVVRINHPDTPDGRDDLAALRTWVSEGLAPPVVMIPKVSSPSDVLRVNRSLLGDGSEAGTDGPAVAPVRPAVVPVIETARGVHHVDAIASSDGVAGLLFGALDLSNELGCDGGWEALLYARSRCVLGARTAGVPVLDGPRADVDDTAGLRSEAERARSLGFDGKAAIHPRQVPIVLEAFRPSEAELARARRVVEAAGASADGVFLLDGSMIDRPVVEAARRLLARASKET